MNLIISILFSLCFSLLPVTEPRFRDFDCYIFIDYLEARYQMNVYELTVSKKENGYVKISWRGELDTTLCDKDCQ